MREEAYFIDIAGIELLSCDSDIALVEKFLDDIYEYRTCLRRIDDNYRIIYRRDNIFKLFLKGDKEITVCVPNTVYSGNFWNDIGGILGYLDDVENELESIIKDAIYEMMYNF